MSKVSIVVPVYNSSKYLNECLDSICGQSYKELEIICVDDGSKDNSLEILREYEKKDLRIKVFTKQNEGKGAASARNMGLANATGKYIMFLDSDDFFESCMVEEVVAAAEEKDAQIVCFAASRFDDKLQKVVAEYKNRLQDAPEKQPFSWKDCPEKIFQICDLIAWNKLYRKDLIDRYDLKFEPIPISDDQLLPALAMVFAERIITINKSYINYRFNTGTSQVDSQPKHPEAAYSATFSVVDRLRKEGIYGEVKKSYLNLALRLMREYFDNMTSFDAIQFLYHKYREEIFPFLGAENLNVDFFYEKQIGEWYELIMNCSLEEILFRAARSYGSPWTTAILRLQVPYEEIERNSSIVLVGGTIVSRFWYAQLVLSDYCKVVAWVKDADEIPQGLQYDKIVYVK